MKSTKFVPSVSIESKDINGDLRVSSNPMIINLYSDLKDQLYELLRVLGALRVCLKLNVPVIEAGNNIGVEIQQEILMMLEAGQQSGAGVLKLITRYFAGRAKLQSDGLKFPSITDFKIAVEELDFKQYVNLTQSMLDLRNTYILLFDKINKNKDLLIKPKGEYKGKNKEWLMMY